MPDDTAPPSERAMNGELRDGSGSRVHGRVSSEARRKAMRATLPVIAAATGAALSSSSAPSTNSSPPGASVPDAQDARARADKLKKTNQLSIAPRCSTPGPRSLGQGRPTLITIRGGKQYTQGVSSLIAGGGLTALLAIALGPARGYAQGAPGPIPADPNLKVAFIGDSGNGSDFRRVLQLIKAEGAHMVLHQGDFDYADNARRFFATIDSILGDDFPYFASVGNHDAGSWRQDCSRRDGCYAKFLKTRMARIGVTPADPELDDQMYSVTYRGLKLVFVGERGARAGDNLSARDIQDDLATDPHVC